MNSLILASSSSYRAQVLSRCGIPFKQINPILDEAGLKNQLIQKKLSGIEVADELSRQKGLSLAPSYPEATIISGDQLVLFENEILGKPETHEKAMYQLSRLNNKTHQLITSTTMIHKNQIFHDTHITTLKMKNLSLSEIDRYLKLDQPYDCAGSCKIEKHGLTLFESIIETDFSAIEGLPLIWITNTLKGLGYEFFKK